MQDIIENVLIQTSPTTNPKLQILKTHFPECFDKEGKLLIDKLEKSLMGGGGGDKLEFSKENYSLNWLGKSYASVLRNEPPTTWIKPNHSFNSTHPNSQNFLIKGDNLEALKLLKNAYEKKIKMIYIDPPYNTENNDFVYKDDRKYTPKELSSLCGMSEEECKKMLEYYSKGKNSHSAWLTFMYPRLSLARNLLKEDGVIFISIDDNEQAQLKLLCDEIFGEENFVFNFSRLTSSQRPSQEKYASTTHDFLLCYAKNKEYSCFERVIKRDLSNVEFDEIGRFIAGDTSPILASVTQGYSKGGDYDFEYNGKIYLPIDKNGKRRRWLWSRERMEEAKKLGILVETKSGLRVRNYIDMEFEVGTNKMIPKSPNLILTSLDLYNTDFTNNHGTSNLSELGMGDCFNFPKPVSLIAILLKLLDLKNDIILDFFAGSGTTAQAVMELNAEDNGNRRFILVQLPESIDEKKSKTAYDFVKNTLGKDEPKISDITQERIIRASKQIREKHPEYQGDLGFQVFELEEIPSELAEIRQSNFEKINHLFANEDIDKMLDIEAILQSFCLYDSIPLGAELEKVDLGGYIAYKFQERIYLLHQGFQTKHLQEFLRKMDDEESFCVGEIVLLAYCFESARRREIAEAISYYNKKSRELKIVVRG